MNRAPEFEGSGVLRHIDGMINHGRRVAGILLTSLALGGGTAALIEGVFDASAAAAQSPTPRARTGGHKPDQVQEYVKIIASDPNGDPLPIQPNTFLIAEQCKLNGKPSHGQTMYSRANQPLGKCDVGSSVKVVLKAPRQGEWVNRSGSNVQVVKKATPHNNHNFKFIEQQVGDTTPTPTQPAPSPEPTPTPTPTPPPGNTDPYASGNIGTDVSWPQCGTANETPSGFSFGIVDVNDGLGYSTNPCLESEAGNFPDDELNLYVNTGWYSASSHINPDSPRSCAAGDENCLAYNYGYNAGTYAVSAATGAGISVNTRWWLDVESNASWANDTAQNRNSLQGEYDALIAGGATEVGAYSTTVQWNDITGSWINNWVSWGATTWTTAAGAKTYCTGHEFTGGTSEIMQFTPTSELDEDVAC